MKTVITKQALETMLAFLIANNLNAIQIYRPGDTTMISGKETPSSSQGYVINHSFKFIDECNNLGKFECITVANEHPTNVELKDKTYLFADHKRNAIMIITTGCKQDGALLQAKFVIPNFDEYSFEFVNTIDESKITLLNIIP